MKINKSKVKFLSISLAVVFLAALMPLDFAQAVCPFSFSDCINDLQSLIVSAAGTIISWAAKGITEVLRPEYLGIITGTTVVRQAWEILRNIINLFFILVLIVVAFGTIFNMKGYTYEILPSFFIAAVLVNFSFAMGEYVIAFGNYLGTIVLKTISGLTTDLGTGLALAKNFPTTEGVGDIVIMVGGGATTTIATLIFTAFFLFIAMGAMVTAFIFLLIRIPILWFILLLGPIAFFSYGLPSLRKNWTRWWKELCCWSFFLPGYLFFLMFAIMFIRSGSSVAVPAQQSLGFLGPGGSIQTMIFYFLSVFFMIYGIKMGRTLACGAGTGAVKVMFGADGKSGAMGYVRNYFPGSRRIRGFYAGVKEGTQTRIKDLSERGIPIGGKRLFSEQEARLRDAKWKERFGGEAVRGAEDQQLGKEVSSYKERFEKITDVNQLRNRMDSGSRLERLAAAEVLKDRDALSVPEYLRIYRDYGGSASVNARKFASGIDFAKMSSGERENLYAGIDDVEIQRKILKIRAEKGDLRRLTGDALTTLANRFILEGDRRDFLNKVQKDNFENSIRAQVALGFLKDSEGEVIRDYGSALKDKITKMKIDEILELSNSTLAQLVNPTINEETARIIEDKLNNKQVLSTIPGKVDNERLATLQTIIEKNGEKLEKEEIAQLKKQAKAQGQELGQAQREALEPLVNTLQGLLEEIRNRNT